MSQDLPLPLPVKIDTTLTQINDSNQPDAPDVTTYGYLYKIASDNGLWWETIGGAVDLTSPDSVSSFGTATSLYGGTITVETLSNTRVGTSALTTMGSATLAGGNTAVGRSALAALPNDADQGIFTAVGYEAGKSLVAGFASTFLGFQAGALLEGSNYDIAIGHQALSQTGNSGGSNIAIGPKTMYSDSFEGTLNVCVGGEALHDLTSGGQNVVLGYESGYSLTTGSNNTLLGHNCGFSLVDADDNVIIGKNACASLVSEGETVSIGTGCMPLATAGGNTCVGNLCFEALTTGVYNSSLGNYSSYAITAGSYNTVLGQSASPGAAHDYCIVIGSDATSSASNQIRIGFDSTLNPRQTTCFIDGIRGKTTGQNDAVAMLVDSKGQLGTISSSIRYKENVLDVSDNVIDSLFKMEPKTFNYIGNPDSKTYGLIAEDIDKILPDIVVHKEINGEMVPETIQYHLLVPLLIGSIKKLNRRCDEMQSQLNL